MSKLIEKYPQEIQAILAKYPPERRRSALLPLLSLAQNAGGSLPASALHEIAELTGISHTDVVSVASFYTLFHLEAGGKYRIQVCTDLPCVLRGSMEYLKQVCAYLGVEPGQTTEDGLFTVEEVKCLAACHRAPVFQLQGNGELSYHENQSLASTQQIIEQIRQSNPVEVQG